MEEESTTTSVLTTVQKFEASKFVFKTPMNTSPKALHLNRDHYQGDPPLAEILYLDDSSDSPPSTPTEPPALPTTDPPYSDEESEGEKVEKVQKKTKKKNEGGSRLLEKFKPASKPGSPKKSPEKTKASPDESRASPEKTKGSPEKTKGSSEKTKASPEKTKASPEKTKASSEKTKASPEKTISKASPERTTIKTSPLKGLALNDTVPSKSTPNLNLVPRKSSLKKTRSKSRLDSKGIWFNMSDQYPVENFSGREKFLDHINQVVHGPKSRDVRPISRAIVLVGKASMGKSEIARKFAFKFYVDCNGKGNVIWVDGSSKEKIVETLLALEQKELLTKDPGSMLELNGEEQQQGKGKKEKKKKSDVVAEEERIDGIVSNRIFQDNPTLFIYDNARSEEEIVQFIPKLSPFGCIPNILVTSSSEMNWNNARVLKVEEFEFKEAVQFLLNIFEDCQGFTKFQAEDLAKELHRFPPLMQKARKIVLRYLQSHGDSDRAILKLEKNIGLVRRLKGEEIIESKEVEIGILSTDRGIYYDEDSYIREYDGELRNHQISMQIHQLEATLTKILERNDLTILTANLEPYILAILASMAGKNSRIQAIYDTENSDESRIDLLREQLNADDENLIKSGKVELRLVEIPTVKPPKQTKTSPLFDKIRSEKKSFDLILCSFYADPDLGSVKKLLTSNGRFVTSMSSANVSLMLKKSDQKKFQIKIMKHDFPELLVIGTKI